MTRLAVLADIHGNLPALEAVLADLAPCAVDQVIVAGDVINWGPFSAQVMARVVAAGWAVVRGNNEFYLVDYETPRAPAAWSNPAAWPLLPWLKQQLVGRWTRVVAGWPDSLSLRFPDAPALRVVHGSPRSNSEPIFPGAPAAEVAAMLAGVEETTVIAAHTHLPLDRRVPGRADGLGWRVLNPGSVGVPLDGEHVSRYLLLDGNAEGWTATRREVPLDPAPVLREFERQDFSAACGVIGHFVIEEFRHARLELPPFLAYRLNGDPLPLERGGPVRMLVPWAHGFKSIKWLHRIALTNDYRANDTYAEANNDPESYLKTAAYLDSVPESIRGDRPVAIRGTVISGLSGLKRVEYWLRRTTDKAPDLSEDDPAWGTAIWLKCGIDPPPSNWSHVFPANVASSEVWGFDTLSGKPKEWPLRYGMTGWTANIGLLPRGTYEIRARAVDLNGFAQPEPRADRQTGLNPVQVRRFEVFA